ncbi:unannotated protein [freshwater metagenome]|uniref:Unannotated protein n=1 Tax=freshwater metagenome TaxID=449393 RepID=A0A6J6S232_9ZZZZ
MHKGAEFVVVENGAFNNNLTAGRRLRVQQIALRSQRPTDSGDELFSDCVKRWIRYLRKKLCEVIEQKSGARREDSNRSIGPHRAKWLKPVLGHGLQDELHFLVGVSKELLTLHH